MAKKYIPLVIVILSTIVAGFALLHAGLPPTHDGEYHVIRFYEFDKTLRDGNFYPRWAADLNNTYGVPLFNYVYPLPNYIASLFHLLGFSFIDAFKANMFLATVIGGIGFYYWTSLFWGKKGGVIASVFYTFSPYHFLDIYIRGSVGEVWTLALFPLFLWQITIFIKEKKIRSLFFSSILFSLVIFSHNILGLMFFTFSLFYIVFLLYQYKRSALLLSIVKMYILALALSAVFWLPALVEKHYVQGLQIYDIANNFPEIYQLLIPSWGSGFSGTGLQDQMSFQIGIANVFAIIFAFFLVGGLKRKEDRQIILFFLLVFCLVIFLMLRISLPVWSVIPLLSYFQFPWRLLSLVIIITSFLAGSMVLRWRSNVVIGIVLAGAMLLTIPYARPAFYHPRNDEHYVTRSNFIHGTNSPGDMFNTLWFKNTDVPHKKLEVIKGKLDIVTATITSQKHMYSIQAHEQSLIRFHTAYFPGWVIVDNGNKQHTTYNKSGIMEYRVTPGKHIIELVFTDTLVRQVASYITGIAFIYSIIQVVRLSIYENRN